MTPVRVIDTQRLSTLAHAYEREIVQFVRDLMAIPAIQRIRQEMEKVEFEEIRIDAVGDILGRIGSGKHVIAMDAHADPMGAAGMAGMVYAGKLIHELGMYDDFTLWVAGSVQRAHRDALAWTRMEDAVRPDCRLIAEPTNLCIKLHEAALEDSLSESHPLVQAAIATYETLFELPPIIGKRTSGSNGVGAIGVPTIGFGPGEEAHASGEHAPTRHLLKAAQFYAAFPMTFVDTVRRR
jgi:hypothetical protein